MLYLGGLSGSGVLKDGNQTIARARYEFDGFLISPGHVTGCGEICMAPEALREVFGRKNLHLVTDDGHRLSVQFSDKRLVPANGTAHVDVGGDLPGQDDWRH